MFRYRAESGLTRGKRPVQNGTDRAREGVSSGAWTAEYDRFQSDGRLSGAMTREGAERKFRSLRRGRVFEIQFRRAANDKQAGSPLSRAPAARRPPPLRGAVATLILAN